MRENGSRIVFTFCSCGMMTLLDSQARMLQMPLIVFPRNKCRQTLLGGSTFVFHPSPDTEWKLIADIVHHHNWKRIALVYDSSTGITDILGITKALSRYYISTLHLNMASNRGGNSTQHLEENIRKITALRINRIVLKTDRNNGEMFLLTASTRGVLGAEYYWMMVMEGAVSVTKIYVQSGKVMSKLGMHVCDQTVPRARNESLLAMTIRDALRAVSIAADLSGEMCDDVNITSCTDSATNEAAVDPIIQNLKRVNKKNRQKMARTPPKWVQPNSESLVPMMVAIDGESGSIKFNDKNYLQEVEYEICSTHKDSNDTIVHIGKWSSEGSLVVDDHTFRNSFHDFNGATIRVLTKDYTPFTIEEKVNNVTSYSGMLIDMLKLISEKMNFKYTLSRPKDDQYGAKLPNGKWTGMVGEVARGEADLAIAPFTMTALRASVIDFSAPWTEEGVGILTKLPDENDRGIFRLYQPLTWQVWCFTGVAVVLTGLALLLVGHLKTRVSKERESNRYQVEFIDSLWKPFAYLMEQGDNRLPVAASGRLILGFFWIFVILMVASYTANLAAFLTVSLAAKPINNLQELADRDDVAPVLLKGANLADLFSNADDVLYKRIWNKMKDSGAFVPSSDEAEVLVKTGKYAFLTDKSFCDIAKMSTCNTYAVAEETFNSAGIAFVLPKKASFKKLFDRSLRKMQESGLFDKLMTKWWPKSTCFKKTTPVNSLDLKYVAGPFIVYLAIVAFSGMCLMAELAVQSYRRG